MSGLELHAKHGVSLYKHGRSRGGVARTLAGRGLRARSREKLGADVAGRAGAEVVDVVGGGAGDLGSLGHDAEVPG